MGCPAGGGLVHRQKIVRSNKRPQLPNHPNNSIGRLGKDRLLTTALERAGKPPKPSPSRPPNKKQLPIPPILSRMQTHATHDIPQRPSGDSKMVVPPWRNCLTRRPFKAEDAGWSPAGGTFPSGSSANIRSCHGAGKRPQFPSSSEPDGRLHQRGSVLLRCVNANTTD